MIDELASLLIYILPAMAANGAPVVAAKFYGKGHPIDFGKKLSDGRRILGDGKTFEGFLVGVLAGTIVGVIETLILDVNLIGAAIASSVGALVGDIVGSFIKRRLGKERGEPAPLLDQLDFYVGALLMLYVMGYEVSATAAIIMAMVIGVLHVSTNMIAHRLGLKDVPW